MPEASQGRLSALDRIAEELVVASGAAPAAVIGLGVQVDGAWVFATGAAGCRPSGELVTPSALFDLASVSKPFVAASAARLARQRQFDFEAPLASLVEEARGTPSGDLPVELFLSHRAGLEAHRSLFAPLHERRLVHRARALAEAAGARRTECVGKAPAAGFPPIYSDLGYLMLGEALARAARVPLDEIVAREIAEPLGLEVGSSRQFFRSPADFVERVLPTEWVAWRGGLVSGVVHDENAWAIAGHGLAGHAGLFGTVQAVLRFGAAMLDALAGRDAGWLGTEDAERLTRERPGGTLRAGFDGKSVALSAAGSHASPETFGHLGFTGTSVWCDPRAESVTVLLSNRVCPTRENTAIRAARPSVHDALFALARAQKTPKIEGLAPGNQA